MTAVMIPAMAPAIPNSVTLATTSTDWRRNKKAIPLPKVVPARKPSEIPNSFVNFIASPTWKCEIWICKYWVQAVKCDQENHHILFPFLSCGFNPLIMHDISYGRVRANEYERTNCSME